MTNWGRAVATNFQLKSGPVETGPTILVHCEKETVVLTLLRLSQLQLNMTSCHPHTEFLFLLYS